MKDYSSNANGDIASMMSQNDLKQLGMDEVAYMKKYRVRGETAWVLHAADGVALAVQKSADDALIDAHGRDLDIVSLH